MSEESLDFTSKRNFILQQGVDVPSRKGCPVQYSALLLQPRVVAGVFAIALALQSIGLFLALGVVLWWSALLPRWNPFDAFYNATLARKPGHPRLEPAPPPRRFAQTLAGGFSVSIAAALWLDQNTLAYVLEAFFAVAVLALAFGRFCFGSFVYHLLRGRFAFARETLPWVR